MSNSDKHSARDGEVVIYKRKGSPQWQARFKLPDGTWHRISTRRTSADAALIIACSAYDKAGHLHAAGVPPISKRFRDVSRLAVQKMDDEEKAGQGKKTYTDYKQAIDNYLDPFFGKYQIDKITQDVITQFDAWRIAKMRRQPAASTINNHNGALNKVFDTAISHGWTASQKVPILKNRGVKGSRRPAFTKDEWEQMVLALWPWVEKAPHQRSRNIRELMAYYVAILGLTGIRTGIEANNLKWKHIRWHQDKDSGHRILMVVVDGKTGKRELVARNGCAEAFRRIQLRFDDLKVMAFDELLDKKVDQYVFRMRDGKRSKNLYHVFHDFLNDVGLLQDAQGGNRTLYSLRHTYATMRLVEDRVAMHTLARQMGTSSAMLEQHYSHLKPIMAGAALAGKPWELNNAPQPTPQHPVPYIQTDTVEEYEEQNPLEHLDPHDMT